MKFQIEQIALCPPDPEKAIAFLKAIGLDEWIVDIVNARGAVHAAKRENTAVLAFNYQAQRDDIGRLSVLELEVLHYTTGENWMQYNPPSVSHLGMHCSSEELEQWRARFFALGVGAIQDVWTTTHSNPAIAGKRWYHYCIFATRRILGVDLKFIVRCDNAPSDRS